MTNRLQLITRSIYFHRRQRPASWLQSSNLSQGIQKLSTSSSTSSTSSTPSKPFNSNNNKNKKHANSRTRGNHLQNNKPNHPTHTHPKSFVHSKTQAFYGNSRTRVSVNLGNNKNNPLFPHIYTCLSELSHNRQNQEKPDTGFSVAFLGTAGNIPTMDRNTSSTCLRLGGKMFLLDAGEGLQRQFNFTSFGSATVTTILITHMHSDHVCGLPGMILSIQNTLNASRSDLKRNSKAKQSNSRSSKQKEEEGQQRLDIYGPPGLYEYLGNALKLTYAKLNLNITVHELQGSNAQQHSKVKNWLSDKPPYFYSNLQYQEIYPTNILPEKTMNNNDSPESRQNENNIDGTTGDYWTLNEAKSSFGSTRDSRKREFHVYATEILHSNGVPTFGYIVEEPPHCPPIDPQKAMALGVHPGRKYTTLKSGLPVESDDKPGNMVYPEEVLKMEEQKQGRKFVLLGDNRGIAQDSALFELGKGCDILVNECTANDRDDWKASYRGHSTAEMTGRLARSLDAKVCVINHLNVHEQETMHNKVTRVAAASSSGSSGSSRKRNDPNVIQRTNTPTVVVPAFDFMEIIIPAGGFDFNAESGDDHEA